MLPDIDYLGWAIETFPHAKWDLATSGLPSISEDELGVPAGLSDIGASRAFAAAIAERYGVPVTEVVPALGTSGALWIIAASVLTTLPRSAAPLSSRPPASARSPAASVPSVPPSSRSFAARAEPFDVLVEDPTYEPLLRVIEGFGANVLRVPRLASEAYRLDPARVADALTDRTRLVVVASPHNPTGAVTPDEDLAAIAHACAARGAYLLVDEVYRELVAPRTTARALAPNILTAASLTKCFGVGWARAGWALLPAELRRAAHVAEMHTAGVLPTLTGAIGAHALRHIDALEQRERRLSAGKRAIVDAFLARHPQLSWTPPPPRALFGFVHAPGIDVGAGLTRAAREHGVIVVPGAFFGDPDAFRLSWASLSGDALTTALDLLARSLGLHEAAAPLPHA